MAFLPFSTSLDKQLIKLVEQNPILYDPSHEEYMEQDLREMVWSKIGDEIDIAAPLCKARWVNIRDNMRRKVRRDLIKKRNGDDTPCYKYKYESELSFLLPHFKLKQMVQLQDDQSQEGSVASEEIENMAMDSQEADQSEQQIYFQDDESDSKSDIQLLDIPDIPVQPSPRKRKRDSNSTNSSNLPTTATTDQINIFLDAVGSTLRNLNPYYLSVAKCKIFQVAQECEMQQILNKGEVPGSK